MPDTYSRAFVLGVVSGMRSALGPALVSHRLSRYQPPLGLLNFMRSPTTATVFKVAAAGEVVGDKLPRTPARTQPGPLIGRTLSGALCGAALGRSSGQKTAAGAAVGALGAVVGAYTFYELRRTLTRGQGVPDLVAACVEDALALGVGGAALPPPSPATGRPR